MATLCGLPPEIHIEILSKLPDLRSLAAAMFTSRAIYISFTIARHHVMERVLASEIPLASIIGEIDCLLPQDYVAALQDRSSGVRGKAIDMLCVNQGLVSAWCRRFCEDTLPELSSDDHSPPSPSERFRIQRAFYQFWALSRPTAAFDIAWPSLSDDVPFAQTYMLRYSRWEVAELAVIYRYFHQKLERLCFLHGRQVPDDYIHSEEDKGNKVTVYSLALRDLRTLHSLLFSPQTATSIFDTYKQHPSCFRIWAGAFTADWMNRSQDPTAFPPRCICERRDMPADEYNACLAHIAHDAYRLRGKYAGDKQEDAMEVNREGSVKEEAQVFQTEGMAAEGMDAQGIDAEQEAALEIFDSGSDLTDRD
ncbi:hypothetical protein FN846DRAFT_907863 [Sphaerosporella brunnea]|uniref:F-box domain-containing protein n=1 Tax=Sphaerosporella brunnea TaxID=1250544 RepID=A0A5J5EV12_9PEZI|nr:hypothetical protein FN846DRAFT_907863 [Sphaerosporella brunnea]